MLSWWLWVRMPLDIQVLLPELRASLTNPINLILFYSQTIETSLIHCQKPCKGHLIGMQDSGGILLDAPQKPHNPKESEQPKHDKTKLTLVILGGGM